MNSNTTSNRESQSISRAPRITSQTVEPKSMPYNVAPPVLLAPLDIGHYFDISLKISGNDDAQEKRQQMMQHLQKYFDERQKAITSCKSQVDLSNTSEKGEDKTTEKVS